MLPPTMALNANYLPADFSEERTTDKDCILKLNDGFSLTPEEVLQKPRQKQSICQMLLRLLR